LGEEEMMNSPNPGEEKMNNAPNPGEEDMANASNPANEPENNPPNQPEGGSNRPKRRRLPVVLRRTSIALGIPLLVGAVGGACWMWVFVHEQLAPMVQKNLTELLNRPVLLGQVESFSFNGVRFGPSSIPATPTDPDRASVQAVDVAFDPLQLLLTRTLRLDVTLVKPDAYIEEDARGRWVSTTIKSEEGKGPITTDLQAVRLQNANVVLMPQSAIAARQQSPLTPVPVPVLPQSSPALPQPQVATPQVTATPQPQVATPQATATPQPQVATPQTTVASPQTPLPNRLSGVRTLPELPAPPNSPTNNVLPVPPLPSAVTFTGVNGTGRFLEQNQRILFEAAGQSVTGGTFSISGENRPAKEETNLKLQGQNLVAPEISSLVKLPLDLQAGLVDGNLQLRLQGSNSPLIDGTALLKNVTAQAPDLPRAFAQTNGQLNFKGSQIGLENISTLYGQIPAQAIGAVDFQSGFNIAAKTSPVQVQALLNTFDLKLPVSATGEMQADLKILGPTSKPVVSGTLAATKPAVIDKLKLAAFSADFGLEGSTLAITSLKAKPAVGGQLDGSGQVKLGQIGDVAFKFQGKNLPGDAIARVYGSQPSFRIGRVQAQGQVKGPINNIETILSFNAPTGTYPASGELAISSSGKTALRNTTVNVAGGALKVNGNSSPSAGGSPRFSGTIDASKVNPGLLAQGSTGTNEPKERGTTVKGKNKPSENSNGTAVNPTLPPISGKINVAGTANPSFPDELRASGTLNVAGGTVKINDFKVLSRTWQASLIAAGIDVGRLSPQLPPQLRGKFDGRFQVYGSVDSFQPETIRATGSGQMNVAGGTLKASSIQVKAGRWQAAVQAYGVQLSRIVPQVPPQLRSPFTGTFNLSGSLVSSQPETISGTGQGTLAVAGGTVRLSNGKLNQGRFSASVEASGVELGRLSPQAPPTLGGAFTGQFDVAGNIDNFSTSTILAAGQGRLDVGGGTVTATNVKINEGRFSASVESSGVELGRLAPQVPQQLRGAIAGKLDLSGDLDKLEANAIQGTGQARLNSAGGLLTATNIKLAEGRWQAAVSATNFDLNRLNPQLKPESRLTGTFNLAGNLDKLEPNAIVGNGSGRLNTAGGTITASNVQLASGRWQAQGKADGVRLGSLSPQVPPQLRGGQLNNAAFNLVGSLADFQPQTIQGTASGTLVVAGGTIKATSLQLASGRWQATGSANGVKLATLSPQLPPQLKGGQLNNASFNLVGSLADFQPQTIKGTASGTLVVAGGTIKATSLQLASGRWQATGSANGVKLATLSPQLPPQLRGGQLNNAEFNLVGSLADFQPQTIQGTASGTLLVAGGTIKADSLQLASGRWQARGEASNFALETLSPQIPPQLKGGKLASGSFNLAGSLANFQPQTIEGTASGTLNVAGGTITATNARLAAGRFEANLQPSKILLSRFSDQLRGRLTGDLNVSGSLAALNPSDLKASGQLNFSEGLAAIDRDLTAAFSWDGQNLQIQRATGQGLEASGVVAFGQVRGAGVPPVKDFNLNVRADNFNLTSLPVTLPNNLKVAGLVDFNGRVTGTPSAPNVVGDSLRVRNFEVAGLKFEAQLAGTVQSVAGQGTNLRLQGTEDRLELELSPKLQPVAFAIRRTAGVPADQQIEATGKTQGDLLVADVKNFPLKILKGLAPKEAIANLPPQIATQNIGGQLSGNFSLNLAQNSVVANNVAIAKPVLGPVQGDVLAINSFTYTNGVANVTNATFDQGSSRYTLAGSFNQDPKASPQFKGSVKVAQGKVQDVLKTLQIFELADLSNGFGNAASYAKADDIKPIASAGLPEQTLQTQLRRFSEIQALLDQSQRRREASPVPELRDLEGNFTGEIIAEGSLKQGIKAEFDLGGSEWKWCTSRDRCPYTANQVIVKGNFENGVLTLLPLRIESDKTLLAFSGNIGGDQQTGQLRVQNVPAEALEQFANLPVDISGQLNGTVAIAGSIQNPQARGELTLTDGRLNGAPVQAAQGGFNYADSRLAFSSNIVIEQTPNTAPTATTLPVADTQPTLVASTQPISISGSIPYKLPFASTQPDNNAIALNVDVKNEGLALLNLLTSKQVTWVDGQGQLQLKVKGTLDPATFQVNNLVAEGTADVANATIRATALPEPLTQVGGKVLFNFDRINVENLQGNFSGGVVAAAGVLPISTPITTDNPLRVNIGELALNLKGLYSGRVKGGVDITGTALAPKIGGEVQLFNGQVLLEERTPETTLASSGTSGTKQVGNTGGDSNANRTTELNGLKLVLGKDVQVTRPPILNFLATGDLIVNGTLDNPRPSGTIELKRGQVNLFTTQFRLDRGYPQTAQFVPERGLDPVLDVRLIAAVPEATRRGFVTAATSSSEISDVSITNLGSVGTVRIQARVDGPASQLSNNLELTSNPSRSESEIVALLGGSFAETLGRGDGTLGLANLAGSALLGNVQNVIGDALGLSEFRLYPTLVPNDKSRGSTLGVAAEAGIDITPKLSTSVSKVLTTDQAPQLNLRYRVNEDVLLRGGTDFSSDSRALVEYEKRF
jgi:translocation and assembly module TamB